MNLYFHPKFKVKTKKNKKGRHFESESKISIYRISGSQRFCRIALLQDSSTFNLTSFSILNVLRTDQFKVISRVPYR